MQKCILGQDDDEELSSDESAHPFMLKELWRYLQCLQQTEAKDENLRQQQLSLHTNAEGKNVSWLLAILFVWGGWTESLLLKIP